MQLTPFGRLEVKLDDLPTITDDPRKTNGDFEKVFAKKGERKKVQETQPNQADQFQAPPPNTPTPGLAPTQQPKSENPEKPQDPSQSADPSPLNPGDQEEMGDTLSLTSQDPKSRPQASPQESGPTRFKLSPGRVLRPKIQVLSTSISSSATAQTGAIQTETGQGVGGVERSGTSNLGKSAGNKSQETKETYKPKETRASYRSADPKRAELAKANRDSIFRQVTMALTQEGGSMFIAIAPPSLGHIALELKLEGDKLRLKIRAEHQEVSDSLRQDLGQLKSLLLSQGMNVEEIDVRTGTQQEQARDGEDFEKSFRKSTRPESNGTATAPSPETRLISPLGIQKGTGIDFIA